MRVFLIFMFLMCTYSISAQNIAMMNGTVNQCSGTFTDSGGSTGNYNDNESFTLTICPDTSGELVQIDFTNFSIEVTDVLELFNGPNTTSPTFGQFSGGPGNSPGRILATVANTSGCITVKFTSDGMGNTTGWEANLSCVTPCQKITTQLDSATPAPNSMGFIRVCVNETITLDGSAVFSIDGNGATYEWDLDNGNTITGQRAVFSYTEPGVYKVNLKATDTNTDVVSSGCTSHNLINQVIQVSTIPNFSGTQATDSQLCFGESTTIKGVVSPTSFTKDCTPITGQNTALPDGSGVSHTSSFTVGGCFDNTEKIINSSDIINVCLNIEHSFSGDLEIVLSSPTGQQVVLFNRGGAGTYLGSPIDDGSTGTSVGANYCFSMSAATVLANAPKTLSGTPLMPSFQAGTYLPVGNFTSLIGSPLNGMWTITITDNELLDNGTFFSWYIDFAPRFLPPDLSFTPTIVSNNWDANSSITGTVGSDITVTPTSTGLNCYTYRVTDDFGCEYTKDVCISVAEDITASVVPLTTPICSGNDAQFRFTATPNSIATYTVNGGTNQTLNIGAAGTEVLTLSGVNTNQVLKLNLIEYADPPLSGSGITASGGNNPTRAEGAIAALGATATILNSANINAANPSLSIVLADVIPVGGTVRVSAAKNDGAGVMTISDGVNTQTFNAGNQDILEYVNFVVGTNTNTLNFTRVSGDVWVNGVDYNITPQTCSVVVNETKTVVVDPILDPSFTLTATCDGAVAIIQGDAGGTFSFNPVPTDGAIIDASTGRITMSTSGATYNVDYTTAGPCPKVKNVQVTVLVLGDSSFTLQPTCDGATAVILGDQGGFFSFNPLPTDGAVINALTGTITSGIQGATYHVEYVSTGICPTKTNVPVTVLELENSGFILKPTCDGARAIITGDTGGVFSFNPLPTDTAILNPITGTITSGISGVSYSVDYTTTGPCPVTSSQVVTVLPVSPPPSITAEVSTDAFADSHTIEVTATGGGISVFEFSLDGGAYVENTPNNGMYTFTDVSIGEHIVRVRGKNECSYEEVKVMVMDSPLFFTPNGDGYNDTWNISSIANQSDATIYIYDRLGKLLKQISPTGSGWDGTYNENPMPTSDYWFTVEYREPKTDVKKTYSGHFALKR